MRYPLTFALCLALAPVASTAASSTVPVRAATWEQVTAAKPGLEKLRLLSAFALSASDEEMEKRLTEAERLDRSHFLVNPPKNLLMQGWLERSPQRAFAFWLDDKVTFDPEFGGDYYYGKLAEFDPERAVKAFEKDTYPRSRSANAITIATVLARKNREAAEKFLFSLQGSFIPQPFPLVIASLAETDPVYAASLVLKHPQREGLGWLLGVWLKSDAPAALAWADRSLTEPAQFKIAAVEFSHRFPGDVVAAERLIEALKSDGLRDALRAGLAFAKPSAWIAKVRQDGWADVPTEKLSDIIRAGAALSAAEAKAFFQSVPPPLLADIARVREIANAWGFVDLDGASAWASSLPAGEMREAALLRVHSLAIELDPKRAEALLRATPPGPLHSALTANAASMIAVKDVAAALTWANTLPDGAAKAAALRRIFNVGVNHNATAAIATLAQLPPGAASAVAYQDFAEALIKVDAARALDWFAQLPPGPERAAVAKKAGADLVAYQPARALEIAKTLTDANERSVFADALAGNFISVHPEAAAEVMLLLPPGDERAKLVNRVVSSVGREDPALAAKLYGALDPGPERAAALRALAGAWAKRSPADAAAWLDSLRGQPDLERAVAQATGDVVETWARSEPARAKAWLATLPEGRARDDATYKLAQRLATIAPREAFDLIAAMPAAQKNIGMYFGMPVRLWFESDPAAARAYIEASALPPAVREEILKRATKP